MLVKVWEPLTQADNYPICTIIPITYCLVFILFSAGNLGTAAFREPQRHSPAQHILYLLRHIPLQLSKLALQDAQACLPTPCHSQTDRACCAPCCSFLSQETDRALSLLFHFVPTQATGNSKFFPRVRAWYTKSEVCRTAFTLKNACTGWKF